MCLSLSKMKIQFCFFDQFFAGDMSDFIFSDLVRYLDFSHIGSGAPDRFTVIDIQDLIFYLFF